MEKQRKKINSIDAEIIKLLAERRDLSREIINLKNEKLSSIRDKRREKELLTKIVGYGKKSGLDSYFVTKVFNEIISDSVKLQNQIVLDKDNLENSSSAKVVAIQGIEGSYSYLAAQKFLAIQTIK